MPEPSVSFTGPNVVIVPTYTDPVTGAIYVHQELTRRTEDWATEAHIPPPHGDEQFGDVESWTSFVRRFGDAAAAARNLLTWNSRGLRAVLDYHETPLTPGRCQWKALCAFSPSLEWTAWTAFACGVTVGQRAAIEQLETLAQDIRNPTAVDLVALLRSLRATVNASAQAELRPDGTTAITFASDKRLAAGADGITLPPEIGIAIPVLRGHVNAQGQPVLYEMAVRLRASVDDSAHLALRFSLQNADRTFETVLAERVAAAKEMLGNQYTLLRAAG